MIVTKIYGGLAGQMLQYALGRKLSLKNKTKLFLDKSWYDRPYWDHAHPRDFKLDKLNVNYQVLNPNKLIWKFRLTHRLKKLNPLYHQTVNEKDFSQYDEDIISAGRKTVLDGYWNSYKYFADIRETLIKEFTPTDKPAAKNEAALNRIRSTNSVSVHFRRGDYKQNEFHGILSKEYYDKAVAIIKEKVANPMLYIFSDETDWVTQNVNFDLPYEIIDFNKDANNHWDIELMKNCRHNIIANSGFSWWGAWLNTHAGKIVIAPERWINHEQSRIDNIPGGWILI